MFLNLKGRVECVYSGCRIFLGLFTNSCLKEEKATFLKCGLSKYAVEITSGKIPSLDPESALLFCYFNQLEYFHQYLDQYEGNVVILIGPIDGHRHCEPEPKYLRRLPQDWILFDQHNIRNAEEDLICIYKRK